MKFVNTAGSNSYPLVTFYPYVLFLILFFLSAIGIALFDQIFIMSSGYFLKTLLVFLFSLSNALLISLNRLQYESSPNFLSALLLAFLISLHFMYNLKL